MKKPSNTSTQGGIQHHSDFSRMRSEAYHKSVIAPVQVKPGPFKMTRAEHAKQSDEDMSEKGHKL